MSYLRTGEIDPHVDAQILRWAWLKSAGKSLRACPILGRANFGSPGPWRRGHRALGVQICQCRWRRTEPETAARHLPTRSWWGGGVSDGLGSREGRGGWRRRPKQGRHSARKGTGGFRVESQKGRGRGGAGREAHPSWVSIPSTNSSRSTPSPFLSRASIKPTSNSRCSACHLGEGGCHAPGGRGRS
eukprot:scaffold31522_cov46-Isochrysis_galbana.AAC.1